ncbi:MAG: hypothetical protein CL582_17735 [Alteromonadaceae bacterium]|nr:hypothetical protein [Alteromonadaceae bacterium]|tara:strand:- start:229 stop:1122 length:894 start_codon:yes stop_codon:yes gene_type:complete
MKIAKYVNSLLPRFDRGDLLRNLEGLEKELSEYTLPSYADAAPLLADFEFKDDMVKDFQRAFEKSVDTRLRGNHIEVTHFLLKKVHKNVGVTKRLTEKFFSRDIVKSSLTYGKAQLLQVAEAYDFINRYARKWLIYTLGVETQMYRQNSMVGKEMTPAEIKWLEANGRLFLDLINRLAVDSKELESAIEGIPDIEIDEETVDAVIANTGATKLDPMRVGVHGVILNPVYHIRMAIAEWQVSRYEAAKEERKMLEYQILDLQHAKDGKNDPKIEKAIEYTRDRITKLNRKIAKMEESV